MRNGLRQGARFCLFAGICLGVLATSPRALGSRADWPIRMTVEVSWNRPELPALPATAEPADDEQWLMSLELTEGRLVEVVSVEGNEPPRSLGEDSGTCRLGKAARATVRARLEAPLSAVLIIRDGARATAFPLIRLLEAPQQTLQGAPTQIKVSRLAWDPIELDLGSGDGVTAPGSVVPVTVGLNVLTPEPSEALVRLVGELRPLKDNGEPVAWTCDQTQVVSTDAVRSPVVVLSVRMPEKPGTYVLNLQATWEPIVALEGSRIGRLIRRKRTTWPGPTMASRRTTLVVLDPDKGLSQVTTQRRRGRDLAADSRGLSTTERPGIKVPPDGFRSLARASDSGLGLAGSRGGAGRSRVSRSPERLDLGQRRGRHAWTRRPDGCGLVGHWSEDSQPGPSAPAAADPRRG